MNGNSVSYSSFGELKKAHTCRCWRSIERANGMGAADEFVMSLSPKSSSQARSKIDRRQGNMPAVVDASPRSTGTPIISQHLQRHVAKMVGIAIARSGQLDNSLAIISLTMSGWPGSAVHAL